jgi:DNA-binding NtrC family response regulator
MVCCWAPQPEAADARLNQVHHIVTTVLVAEDDYAVRLLVITALRRKGYATLAASDGTEAMAVLDDGELVIDAMVSDVDMPCAGGLEVVEYAHSRRPGIPVLLASATKRWLLPPDQLAGAVTLLEKPYRLDQLVAALEAAIAG